MMKSILIILLIMLAVLSVSTACVEFKHFSKLKIKFPAHQTIYRSLSITRFILSVFWILALPYAGMLFLTTAASQVSGSYANTINVFYHFKLVVAYLVLFLFTYFITLIIEHHSRYITSSILFGFNTLLLLFVVSQDPMVQELLFTFSPNLVTIS